MYSKINCYSDQICDQIFFVSKCNVLVTDLVTEINIIL